MDYAPGDLLDYVESGGLRVAHALHHFVTAEALPGTGIDPAAFWLGFGALVGDLAPRNKALLERRDALQQQIDDWHRAHRGQPIDSTAYLQFLRDIGYLLPEPADFAIDTGHVDAEIASIAGPQLVVPVTNARYALNAANARWGSLYDALYGTDVIPEDGGATRAGGYNKIRGAKVIAMACGILDQAAPLAAGSHADATLYALDGAVLSVTLKDGSKTGLHDAAQFVGYRGDGAALTSVLLRHNGLHLEIVIDRSRPIGQEDPAGVADVMLEAAITTIQDLEDSISAVDAEDKVLAYRNWLGLMRGTLQDTFDKGGRTMTRRLHTDRSYHKPGGGSLTLSGRSLMLVRNVGHHMYTDAVLDADGNQTPEGLLDAAVTSLIALHDLNNTGPFSNSRAGSVYIVKPKMHGPEEVAFTDTLFGRVEDLLKLPRYTMKMGIMDEERRTSRQLEGLHPGGKARVAFINTGFLDRTGDEIHTSIEAGPMIRKADMRNNAVDQGVRRPERRYRPGLRTARQGADRQGHVGGARPHGRHAGTKDRASRAGANTAWVPSPTAATLHALHYHQVDVAERQTELANRGRAHRWPTC